MAHVWVFKRNSSVGFFSVVSLATAVLSQFRCEVKTVEIMQKKSSMPLFPSQQSLRGTAEAGTWKCFSVGYFDSTGQVGHQWHFTQHPQITGPVHKEFRHLPRLWSQNVVFLFYFRLLHLGLTSGKHLGLASGKLFPGSRGVGEDILFTQTPLPTRMGSFLHQKLLLSWSSKDEVHACEDIVCAYLNNFWYIL